MQRAISPYDPDTDHRERWSDWMIQPALLPRRTASVHPGARLVLVDADWWTADKTGATAYVIALLDLTTVGRPPADWARDAAWLGQVRLDLPERTPAAAARPAGVELRETGIRGSSPGDEAQVIPR